MILDVQKGDLFSGSEKLVVHGCNAQGVMRSGFAKIVRERYPEAYHAYASTSPLRMGQVIYAESQGKIIANGITQQFYGRDGRRYCSYDAINSVMEDVHRYAVHHQIDRVAMPAIGAGLGGGSWSVIRAIVEDVFTQVQPVLYTLDDKFT